MFKNYLKIAWRNIVKHKGYAFINVFNLGIALAVCLLIAMYVNYERSYDRFFPHADLIYRIPVSWGKGASQMHFAGTMPALAPAMQAEIPEIALAGRVQQASGIIRIDNTHSYKEDNLYFADAQILPIFSFTLLAGERDSAISAPDSLVISQRLALKYFATADVLGKTLQYDGRWLKINGVFKPFPAHCHFNPDALIAYSTLAAMGIKPDQPWNQWGDDLTYVLVKPGTNARALSAKIQALFLRHSNPGFAALMALHLQPLRAIHWDVESRGDMGSKGNRLYVTIFSISAVLLLLIACFNFISLSIARFMERSKEVAVRKVIGASRWQLTVQFMGESLLVASMALALGGALFALFYPQFYRFLKADVVFAASHIAFMAVFSVFVFIAVGIVAPIFPALAISRNRPADIIKKNRLVPGRGWPFRQTMVMIQFAITITLIFGILVMAKQLKYALTTNLGFNRDNVALVSLPYGEKTLPQKYAIFRDELLKNSNIKAVSSAFSVPGVDSRFQMSIHKKSEAAEKFTLIRALPVDFGFVQALGLQIVAGRNFSTAFAMDSRQAVILNEAAAKALALQNPIGETLVMPSGEKTIDAQVIGIVKDFHLASLYHKIEPCILYVHPENGILSVLAYAPAASKNVAGIIRQAWLQSFGQTEMRVRYMDDTYRAQYAADETSGIILAFFMALIIFISCIGLLGLASFVIGRRTKEIGIRKVLGATATQILTLLSFNLVRWLGLSCLLAWPAGIYLANLWLGRFAYRIQIGFDVFIYSGGAAILIAIIAISQQLYVAARTSPAETLKWE